MAARCVVRDCIHIDTHTMIGISSMAGVGPPPVFGASAAPKTIGYVELDLSRPSSKAAPAPVFRNCC